MLDGEIYGTGHAVGTDDRRRMVDGAGMTISSNSVSTDFFDKDGNQYWPCWCGEHRGQYGIEDWLQHHCSHDAPLLGIDKDINQLICVECGKVFSIESK